MNAAWVLCFFALSEISQSESLTLQLSTSTGNRRTVSVPVPQRASIPSITIPVARQTLPTNVNIPAVSTDVNLGVGTGTVFPGTQTTVGTAGLDLVRRGAELIADRIASALGGIAVLVDVLRNTSINGDVVWANIGSSSQALATRLLTIGMNTANTLLQDLNGQLSVNANPSNVLQSFLSNLDLGSIGSFSRSPGLSNQVFFPNGVFPTGQQTNANGSVMGVPGVAETLNMLSGNFNGALPSVTTLSTSRPGLNIPSTTTTDSIAGSTGNLSNPTPQNVNSEVETFLDNLGNNANVGVNP